MSVWSRWLTALRCVSWTTWAWQVHRLSDALEAYGAVITRPEAAPGQSRFADHVGILRAVSRNEMRPRVWKLAPARTCCGECPSVQPLRPSHLGHCARHADLPEGIRNVTYLILSVII